MIRPVLLSRKMYAARAAIDSDPVIIRNNHVSQCVDHVNYDGSKKLPVQAHAACMRVTTGEVTPSAATRATDETPHKAHHW